VDLPYENVAKERREGRETVEKTRNLRSWEFEEFGDLHLPTFSNPHILKLSVLDRESGPVPWDFVSDTHKDRPSFQRVVYRIVTAGQEETAETASPQTQDQELIFARRTSAGLGRPTARFDDRLEHQF